jgi:hypothetical protein
MSQGSAPQMISSFSTKRKQGYQAKDTKILYAVSTRNVAHSRNRTKFGSLGSAEERSSCEH